MFGEHLDIIPLLFLPTCLLLTYLIYKIVDFFIRIPYIDNIQNRYVMVTGCDTGFGRLLVGKLDKLGCHVFAGCLTEEGLEDIQKNCSDRTVPLKLDVTKSDTIQEAFRQVKESIPVGQGLWGLVNNAGIRGNLGPAEWVSRRDHQQVLDVNVLGMAEVINTFLPLLKLTRGRVVNMASSLGRMAFPYSTSYCMSKFAVEGFCDALRPELQMFGVSVHILEPGAHQTNLINLGQISEQIKSCWSKLSDSLQQQYGPEFVTKLIDLGQFMLLVSSSHMDQVVKAYEHALFATFPRGRYLVGWDAYLYVFLSLLPEWLTDFAFWLLSPVPAFSRKPEKS